MKKFQSKLPQYNWFGEELERTPAAVRAMDPLFVINKGGDINPILYKPSIVTIKNKGTLWLNETQTPYKAGWGGLVRGCSWANFIINQSKKELFIFNTHLDHMSQSAMTNGLKLIANSLLEKTHHNKTAGIILGDLNMNEDKLNAQKLYEFYLEFKKCKRNG